MGQQVFKISYDDLFRLLEEKLLKYLFIPAKAAKIAEVIAGSSLDGVYSHGVNRFPRFMETVRKDIVRKDAEPVKFNSIGLVEQWDGNLGPGILNALFCMDRAMELAHKSGMGCVGLKNTNHWLRGGTYGWQAADAGYIGICFTNTKPNMVPWGGAEPRIGNNPFIIGIPRQEGHVVLDMAMSQFSFGKIQEYALRHEKLPYPGGFDNQGNLSVDPELITSNEKAIPIGYWKGSAMSMMIDMLAAILSGGDPVFRIDDRPEEYGLSQVFIAFKTDLFIEYKDDLIRDIIAYNNQAGAFRKGDKVYYPGERTLMTRKYNQENGIPVDQRILDEIRAL